jgi:hypothetical protein
MTEGKGGGPAEEEEGFFFFVFFCQPATPFFRRCFFLPLALPPLFSFLLRPTCWPAYRPACLLPALIAFRVAVLLCYHLLSHLPDIANFQAFHN